MSVENFDSTYDFTMFVDESGQREHNHATTRYFVYAGTIVRSSDLISLENELRGIKRAFLGDVDGEIKSNWLRTEYSERYLQKFGISKARLDSFVEAIYQWIDNAPITFIATVIDKKEIATAYTYPYNPNSIAYQYLLQRFEQFLRTHDSDGTVIVDDFTGKTKAGNKWKVLLQRHHRKLKKRGCNFTKMNFNSVGSTLHFKNSKDFSLIQLSDLCAYNVLRQFRDHGAEWDDPTAKTLNTYLYLDRMLPKFRRVGGVFSGYGIVKAPTKKPSNKWVVEAA